MASATLAPRATAARRRPLRGPAREEPPTLWSGDLPAVVPGDSDLAAPATRSSATPVLAASLADTVADAWETMLAAEDCSCPLCGEAMQPRWSAGAGVVGGRCGGCGTTLE